MMRGMIIMLMGMGLSSPVLGQGTLNDVAAESARSMALMEFADQVSENCQGVFIDEVAMDAEDDRIERALASAYGAENLDAVYSSPTLDSMIQAAKGQLRTKYTSIPDLCEAAHAGSVPFVTGQQPAPDADEVPDEPVADQEARPKPLQPW